MNEHEISQIVVDTSLRIHKDIGCGLLESVYEVILSKLLESKGLQVQRQVSIPINYQRCQFH